MLRIITSKSASAAIAYFNEGLAKEDYYSQGQELVGQWHGKAARELGISGPVMAEQFAALVHNRHPVTGEKLTPRMNSGDGRVPGWDFNWHLPKSASILQALTGDEKITELFRESVAETMADVEKMVQTRIRRAGRYDDRTTGNFVWAEYVHFTARPTEKAGGIPDPHLHIHSYVMNLTKDDAEGRWKAAKIREVFEHAPYFQALFHSRMAMKLSENGYPILRTEKFWEIFGIHDKALLRNFSSRRAEIDVVAAEMGIVGGKGRNKLGALTRRAKRKGVTPAELLEGVSFFV